MKDKSENAENRRSRAGSVLLTIASVICVLIVFVVFYVLTVVFSGQDAASCASGTAGNTGMPRRIGTQHFGNASDLRSALGIPLPEASGADMEDICVFDETYAGTAVWHGRIVYANGAVLDIVMPAAAAPLLQTDGMILSTAPSCDVCNLSAGLCEGEGENCLLFADENAAYSLRMRGSVQELLDFASGMRLCD